MSIEDFDFELPRSQIAQCPVAQRDDSRLLVLERTSGRVQHRRFRELPELLRPSDLVVVNDAQVIAARLLGHKAGTGGAAELLLVRPFEEVETVEAMGRPVQQIAWICLGHASKGLKVGTRIELQQGFSAEIEETLGDGEFRVRFFSLAASTLADLLDLAGCIPLPPYIDREPAPSDRDRYQTVYARRPGSVAAPTAGLHFTPPLLEALGARGIRRTAITLDVGPGTFLPVRERDIANHRLHAERYQIPSESAREVNDAKRSGRRVVAVGTTVVRALESALGEGGGVRPGGGETTLFIHPGFAFRQVDALVTNFHLPRSTLLMLVCAFAGRDPVLAAYRQAVASGYRFFSYGDAMLISE